MKKTRKRISIKYHVTATLDYNIIMAAKITSQRTGDSPTLRKMLKDLLDMEGSVFNADGAYDPDTNFRPVYGKQLEIEGDPTEALDTGDGLQKSSTATSIVTKRN